MPQGNNLVDDSDSFCIGQPQSEGQDGRASPGVTMRWDSMTIQSLLLEAVPYARSGSHP